MSDVERFLAKVDRSGGEEGCWLWTGYRNNEGYGRCTVRGRKYLAHRRAYELLRGPVPVGLVVRHTCDNPPCCNPAHLRVGTHAENSADRSNRKRCGFGCGGLSDSVVLQIRGLAGLISHAKIGALVGCSREAVSQILAGRRRSAAGDKAVTQRAERWVEAA